MKKQTSKQKLDKIGRELSNYAESENAHSLYRLVEEVASVVEKHAGTEIAIKVMKDIGWKSYI